MTQTPFTRTKTANRMERGCLLCGSQEKKFLLTTHDKRFSLNQKIHTYRLVKCVRCGFVYLDFSASGLKDFLSNYPARYWETAPTGRLLQFVQRHLLRIKYRRVVSNTKNGKLLDVGCGTGEMLIYCQKKGWNVYGQDISAIACNMARRGIKNVFCGSLEKAGYQNNYFDRVILNSVLHQMENPRHELLIIKRMINNDGQLIISIPNISSWQFTLTKSKWFHLDSPRHLFYFSRKSITQLLKDCGFRVKRINYPLEECPLDLFHSLRDCFPKPIEFFVLPSSLILKLLPPFRGVMEVVAEPEV